MEKLRTAARIADRILGLLTGILAAILLIYSAYVLYDNFRIGENAFSSRELQQYKPVVTEDDGLDFSKIRMMNPDAVGWVSIYETNINYPIAQGRDDLEYINKDIFGNSSLTGSIYLSSENNGQFLDSYNIIYGHHMDNGAMFGDIDKYEDEEFFMSHRKGELLTPDQVYDLTVFACLKTDAYSSEVYAVSDLNNKGLDSIIEYLREHSDQFIESDFSNTKKIVALSTCASQTTNGRVVIFCNAEPTSAIIHGNGTVVADTENVVTGHNTGNSGWAVLNLVCVGISLFTVIPVFSIRKKYRQLGYSRKKRKSFSRMLDDKQYDIVLPRGVRETEKDYLERVVDDLGRFVRKLGIGIIAEIIIFIFALIVFILTEDMSTPMIISDRYTGLMVGITIIGLITDFIFFRYRGARLPEETDDSSDEVSTEQ